MSFFSDLARWFTGQAPESPYRHEMPGPGFPQQQAGNDYTRDLGTRQEPRYDTEYSGELFDHNLPNTQEDQSMHFEPETAPHPRDLDNSILRDRVFDFMSDGSWHTLASISYATRGSEASVSARLRDFRKEKYGAHTVERIHLGNRLYSYRLDMFS